jgi:hypothetical protein
MAGKNSMTNSITFALAIVLALTTWVAAERKYHPSVTIEMVTSFDLAAYPACRAKESSNCIQGIRFYDADSGTALS